MKEFQSLGAFAAHLVERQLETPVILHAGLEVVAAHIEKVAKDAIGEYQDAPGPFAAWPELADSTKAARLAKGYSENEPLLREGDLRDSITHEVRGLEAVIGSESDIAEYQECGTATIPPRPFIGPAAINSEQVILDVIGSATVVGLTSGRKVHSALGYEFTAIEKG